uniref:Uncharacterized protein n=1 Tax=Opuntia streptacantha TaxID=393608 RepID=A0A7C9F275_OPUST
MPNRPAFWSLPSLDALERSLRQASSSLLILTIRMPILTMTATRRGVWMRRNDSWIGETTINRPDRHTQMSLLLAENLSFTLMIFSNLPNLLPRTEAMKT